VGEEVEGGSQVTTKREGKAGEKVDGFVFKWDRYVYTHRPDGCLTYITVYPPQDMGMDKGKANVTYPSANSMTLDEKENFARALLAAVKLARKLEAA
jgi:hypothetical protein